MFETLILSWELQLSIFCARIGAHNSVRIKEDSTPLQRNVSETMLMQGPRWPAAGGRV